MHRPRLKSRSERFFEDMDYLLLIPVLLMTTIGLIVLNMVLQAGYGAGSYPGNFLKQLGAAALGLFLALLICLLDRPTLRLFSWLVYGLSILLLLYVKVDSFSLAALTGADSWIILPFIGSFQPSELAKIGIAMLASDFFARMKTGDLDLRRGFLSIALIYGLPSFLIYREPDFGTTLVIAVMLLTTIFVWGLDWKYILGLAGASLATFALLWNFSFSPYMKNRILALIFPSQDIAESYHLEQAVQAIAAGGISGNSSGLDIYVPVKESDFIYSAISEYLGMIGTTSLLILIIIFLSRAFYLAYKVQEIDYASSYLLVALAASQSFHFIENMGMNVGLLPITGIPLPFISSGGTSMVMNFLSLGLMLNISIEYKQFTN
ncbi:MAG: FtsW/RodA/SpoVE family cell cycle protein [Eubacteriales bacterium]|nr:FtsW/RodA/SpoVE family cell cycle protein [Clostridiales bacterium]MDY5835596.1 FtsW/RodA/SpoVE family cell cycle protein [Eubacteriales bacterium]